MKSVNCPNCPSGSVLVHHSGRYDCPFCGTPIFRCDCGRVLLSLETLERHLVSRAHIKRIAARPSIIVFNKVLVDAIRPSCTCGRVFKTMETLIDHVRRGCGKRSTRYVCSCGSLLDSLEAWRRHRADYGWTPAHGQVTKEVVSADHSDGGSPTVERTPVTSFGSAPDASPPEAGDPDRPRAVGGPGT